MLVKDFSIPITSVTRTRECNGYETSNIYRIQALKKYINIYQIGNQCLSYLPNILAKFLSISNLEYTYVHNTLNEEPMYKYNSVIYTQYTDNKMIALDIPMSTNIKNNYIIWCDCINNLKEFVNMLVKIHQYCINYYVFDNLDTYFSKNKYKLIIPFLSENGITLQVYVILPKIPRKLTWHIDYDYDYFKQMLSNKYKKYFEKNWSYRYDMDMLATYHAYNFIIEDIFKNKVVYTQVNNDGVGYYEINQTLDQLALAILSESRGN